MIDPRTEAEAHWGGDPEQLIAASEADGARLTADLDAAMHFLIGPIGPYRVARRRDQWEVWPDPALISLTTLDPPETYGDRDTALARARQLAGE